MIFKINSKTYKQCWKGSVCSFAFFRSLDLSVVWRNFYCSNWNLGNGESSYEWDYL